MLVYATIGSKGDWAFQSSAECRPFLAGGGPTVKRDASTGGLFMVCKQTTTGQLSTRLLLTNVQTASKKSCNAGAIHTLLSPRLRLNSAVRSKPTLLDIAESSIKISLILKVKQLLHACTFKCANQARLFQCQRVWKHPFGVRQTVF